MQMNTPQTNGNLLIDVALVFPSLYVCTLNSIVISFNGSSFMLDLSNYDAFCIYFILDR